MPLPINITSSYDIVLPVTKQKIEYRPFVVKEEKALLLAAESKDEKQIMKTIKQIMTNCTFDKVDISKLPVTDLEYLFINVRARSVGETANPNTTCESCGKTVGISVDLTAVGIDCKPPEKQIQLTQTVGVIMNYPNYDTIKELETVESETEKSFKVVIECIEKIYDEKAIYETKDFTKEEVREFVESLTQSSFKKLASFFENLPKLRHEANYTCPSCNHQGKVLLTGIQDFFT